jgi:hypothetical protein
LPFAREPPGIIFIRTCARQSIVAIVAIRWTPEQDALLGTAPDAE